MFRRVYLAVFKNITRSVIFGLVFLAISTLVLSGLSIKTATNESMEQAYDQLDPVVNIAANQEAVFETLLAQGYTREDIKGAWRDLVPEITNEIVEEIAIHESVLDYNYVINGTATGNDYIGYNQSGVIDATLAPESRIVGTFNIDLAPSLSTYEIVEGQAFSGLDENVVIISEELKIANGLVLGDTITIERFEYTYIFENDIQPDTAFEIDENNAIIFPDGFIGTEGWTYKETLYGVVADSQKELTIVGIYENLENYKDPAGLNTLIMPVNDVIDFKGIEDETYNVTSVSFYLNSIQESEAFYEDMSTLPFIEDGSFVLQGSDEIYNAMIAPLDGVNSFINIILVIVVIAGVTVITLIIGNSLKDRKYEIGVLLSLGERKLKLSLQFMFEMLLVGTIAFTASIATSNLIAKDIGETLLDNEVTSSEATDEPMSKGGGGGGGKVTPVEVEVVDEINVFVSTNEILIMYLIGSGIIILSSVAPSMYISRYQPKKILSSGN